MDFKLLRNVAGRSLAVALLALTALSTTQDNSANAQTLQEALRRAKSTNPTIQASRAGTRAAREGINQARAGWKPQVRAQASKTLSWSDTSVSP